MAVDEARCSAVGLKSQMDTDVLITPAARCQTGDDSREDTVMDLRLREAEGNEVGTTESEKKKKKRGDEGGGDGAGTRDGVWKEERRPGERG